MKCLRYLLILPILFTVMLFIFPSQALADCTAKYSPTTLYTNSLLNVQITNPVQNQSYRVALGTKAEAEKNNFIFNKDIKASSSEPINVQIPLTQLKVNGEALKEGEYQLFVNSYADFGNGKKNCLHTYETADGSQNRVNISIQDASQNTNPEGETAPVDTGKYSVDVTYYNFHNEKMEEINGSTAYFSATFFGFTDKNGYDLCFYTDQSFCRKSNKFEDGSKYLESGVLRFKKLCGDGPDALKTDCQNDRDYFHEGNVYSVGVYSKTNYATPLYLLNIYVHHIFPTLTSTNENQFGTVLLYDAFRDTFSSSDRVYIKNPVDIMLSAPIRPGKNQENRNNYQISITSKLGSYSYDECKSISGNVGNDGSVTFTLGDNKKTSSPLSPGSYLIKIKEQVNEDSWTRIRRDECQGGFTYYQIPLEVEQKDGKFRAYITPSKIEKDPDGIENLRTKYNDEFTPLPCLKWIRFEDNKERVLGPTEVPAPGDKCVEYETALGGLSTSPTGFIMTLGRWLLAIGTIAAFGFLLYAGYIIQTSRGDKEKISQAREIITSAVTGLIFLILSIAILEIIGVDILQLPGFSR